MEKELVEKLDKRKRLIDIIQSKPGIYFREIHRESGMAMGELEYHLDILVKMEIISKKRSNHHSNYYPTAELGSADKNIMVALRQPKLREILLFVISNDKVGHGDIMKNFNLIKSTTSFYLNKLLKKELIERTKIGRNVYYSVIEPERILRLLLLYKKGFGDDIVDRVEGLWANL